MKKCAWIYNENRIYSIVNKKDVYNRKKHFIHGWSLDKMDVLKFFHNQKSLPASERSVENGDYVVLFYDRDTKAFGYAAWGNDSAYRQRIYRMK